jgi:hypothetical protein
VTITINQKKFFADLRLTQAYCEQELQRKEVPDGVILRSIINPVCVNGAWFAHMPDCTRAASDKLPISWEEWTKKSDPFCLESFVELFDQQLECKAVLSGNLKRKEPCQGRILVIEYGQNIPDGAAEAETGGFFDGWDLPPIDTWFYNDFNPATGGILFAWIPERFIGLANAAIEIQFLGILHWFEEPSYWKT